MFPKCLFCQVNNEQGTGALEHCVYFIIKFVFTVIITESTESASAIKILY